MALRQAGSARLKLLEQCYMIGAKGDDGGARGDVLSIESLLDALICLFDECCSSTLRKEKNIADFVEFSEFCYYLTGNGEFLTKDEK